MRYHLLLSIVAMKLNSSIYEMKLTTNWGKFCCCSEVRNLMQRRGYHRDRHRHSEACVWAFLIVTRYLIFNQEALMTNGCKVGKCYFHPKKYCFNTHVSSHQGVLVLKQTFWGIEVASQGKLFFNHFLLILIKSYLNLRYSEVFYL